MPASSFVRDLGLVRPARPLRDRHLLVAALAALPVWAGLGPAIGERMLVPASAYAWLSFVVIQPVLEELVFRGLLQGQLLRLTDARPLGAGAPRQQADRVASAGAPSLSVANVVTTAVFVAVHLVAQPAAWALAVAVPSLVFGHLRERFVSVYPPIAMHAWYNLGFALTAWIAAGASA